MKKPINLDLSTLSFPPMAIASILHRVTGILLFLLMPGILYGLHGSLRSEDSFHALHSCMYFKLLFWLFGSSLIYHVLAGLRHIVSDLGWGESVQAARWSAYAVMVLSIVMILLLGQWIC